MFQAILLEQEDGATHAHLALLDEAQLPPGDVTVAVDYSTLNYKDALAITGRLPIVRSWPMVPGIDFAGRVVESAHPAWRVGDAVLVNGFGVGERRFGGLAQRARVPGDWLVRVPEPLSTRDAMALGTAGYTAMLCILALEKHGITPQSGEILVTGAAGGVGSIAIAALSARGFSVTASSGRAGEADYFHAVGAHAVIDRAELSAPGKPLAAERWAGVIDSVGSHTLVNALAATRAHGAVAACGLAQGMDFPGTVAPFILRGVTLYGIDSVMAPMAMRESAWARLAGDVGANTLALISRDISLADAIAASSDLLDGRVRGRLVVKVGA